MGAAGAGSLIGRDGYKSIRAPDGANKFNDKLNMSESVSSESIPMA